MEETPSLSFRIGELTAQISSLIESNRTLADSLSRLEMRFENAINGVETRLNQRIETIDKKAVKAEEGTTELKIKFAGFSAVVSLVVSVVFAVLEHFVFKI